MLVMMTMVHHGDIEDTEAELWVIDSRGHLGSNFCLRWACRLKLTKERLGRESTALTGLEQLERHDRDTVTQRVTEAVTETVTQGAVPRDSSVVITLSEVSGATLAGISTEVARMRAYNDEIRRLRAVVAGLNRSIRELNSSIQVGCID